MSEVITFPPIEWPADAVGPLTYPDLPGMELRIVRVGPELAQVFLDQSIKAQRNVSIPTERTYSNDMKLDFWKFLGDPIRVDVNGATVDGQHRAKAIVRSGEPQIFVVITGLEEGAMKYVDMGRRRSYADTLRMREIPSHMHVAALVNGMWYWYGGSYGDKNVPRLRTFTHSDTRPSNARLDAMYDVLLDRELDPVASVNAAHRMKFNIMSRCPLTAISVAHMILGHIDPYNRDTFFSYVMSTDASNDLTSEFPPNMLRDKMRRSAEGKPDGWSRAQWLHMIFKAYNAWVAGETIGKLQPPTVPVKPESWAYPQGLVEVAGNEEL